VGFGARDVRPLVVLEVGATALFPMPGPPAKDCLAGRAAGGGGGPMDVRVPARGLVTVTDGALVLEGVLVRGVDAPESCFVGDFVGD
jgi:hypothetical protein